ncbi:Zn(II)2Cys6 transcription factor [Aspergillus mulundensis]|uniref:Zn(2)-C6 fungal-type domain-containing protein n=1 Tax=Aspergillus mulundensis TaxID=1810919 RepID=A0A3D8QIX6_9EURO|nr:Uncharacterized protein DSM5745_10369 [Aspergillus mulundensis]RDW61697.1 Uncharacterized protein DSM5745_10369 [Aspergillus mulundensis]
MSACSGRVKTCQTCATAKIRCLRSPDSPICDRCLRLNKPCYFRPARLRQSSSRKETRLETLERRVNQLLGQASQGQSSQSHSPSDFPETTDDVVDKGILSLDEATALLDSFLQFMMPRFPFVVLPTTTTVDELREQTPFLFLAVLSVSVTDSPELKRTLDEEMRTALAERTVLSTQPPSLETLQGLLVVLAWSQHQTQQRSPPRHFSTYLHMAIGLAVDLRLDRPVEARRGCRRMNIGEWGTEARPPKTLRAEQRAAIGCSLLSTCCGIITQERCTFPWAPELEAFAVALAENPEYASDQTIIHLVRLQHVMEEIDRISVDQDSLHPSKSNRTFQHIFRTFQGRIQDYTNLLPPELTNNFLLATQLHTVNLYLCQVSLFDRKSTFQLPMDIRSEILCHGLAAAKSFYGCLMSIPRGSERRFSYSQWLQSGFNMIVACKLTLMAVSDEALCQGYPQVQTLCDALNMPGILRTRVLHAPQRSTGVQSQATGFDYRGWLQWIEDWFMRQYSMYLSRRETSKDHAAVPVPVPSTATVPIIYAPQDTLGMNDVSTEDFSLPPSADSISWASFPDIPYADNPLAWWMDLGLLPM